METKFLSKSVKRISHPSHGGALLEFALALPLCIFLVFGVFELGRLLIQYSWIQQTSYNAALLGSGFTLSSPNTEPGVVAAQLYALSNSANKNSMTRSPQVSIVNPSADTIEVGINGQMNLLTNFYPLGVDVKSRAPTIIIPYSAGSANQFGNYNGGYYDCNGNLCGGNLACSPVSC